MVIHALIPLNAWFIKAAALMRQSQVVGAWYSSELHGGNDRSCSYKAGRWSGCPPGAQLRPEPAFRPSPRRLGFADLFSPKF